MMLNKPLLTRDTLIQAILAHDESRSALSTAMPSHSLSINPMPPWLREAFVAVMSGQTVDRTGLIVHPERGPLASIHFSFKGDCNLRALDAPTCRDHALTNPPEVHVATFSLDDEASDGIGLMSMGVRTLARNNTPLFPFPPPSGAYKFISLIHMGPVVGGGWYLFEWPNPPEQTAAASPPQLLFTQRVTSESAAVPKTPRASISIRRISQPRPAPVAGGHDPLGDELKIALTKMGANQILNYMAENPSLKNAIIQFLSQRILETAQAGYGIEPTTIPTPFRQPDGNTCTLYSLLNGALSLGGRERAAPLVRDIYRILAEAQVIQGNQSPALRGDPWVALDYAYQALCDRGFPVRCIAHRIQKPLDLVSQLFQRQRFAVFYDNDTSHVTTLLPLATPSESRFALHIDSMADGFMLPPITRVSLTEFLHMALSTAMTPGVLPNTFHVFEYNP